MENHFDVVVVANTNLAVKDVETYKKIADENGYEVEVMRLNGGFKNVHDVPEETLERMKTNMQDYPGELIVKDYE